MVSPFNFEFESKSNTAIDANSAINDPDRPTLLNLATQLIPRFSLFFPIWFECDWAEGVFGDGVAACGDEWEIEDRFLNVRCEEAEVHDLSEASAGTFRIWH